MNGTNIKFMDIFKFLTFMPIYKRKIKLVHRKLKQYATSATKYFGEQQTTTKFHFHWIYSSIEKTRVKKNIYTFGNYVFVNISDNVKVPRNDEYLDFS